VKTMWLLKLMTEVWILAFRDICGLKGKGTNLLFGCK
jgi:hypothetical protein